jgi:hypothetical protein
VYEGPGSAPVAARGEEEAHAVRTRARQSASVGPPCGGAL